MKIFRNFFFTFCMVGIGEDIEIKLCLHRTEMLFRRKQYMYIFPEPREIIMSKFETCFVVCLLFVFVEKIFTHIIEWG